jgi:hypothetical protein
MIIGFIFPTLGAVLLPTGETFGGALTTGVGAIGVTAYFGASCSGSTTISLVTSLTASLIASAHGFELLKVLFPEIALTMS